MPPGCSATRPEAAGVRHTSPVHAKGLAKIGEVGKARCRQTIDFPGSPGMQTRRFGGFCSIWVLGLVTSLKSGSRAAKSAHMASVHQDFAGSNRVCVAGADKRRDPNPKPADNLANVGLK
jgi:hypothetical protein